MRPPFRRTVLLGVATAVAGALLFAGISRQLAKPVAPHALAHIVRPPEVIHEPIKPIDVPVAAAPAKVALGRRLFADRRLSADGTIACIDCHDLAHGGADGRKLAIGIGGRIGAVNTPTVFNADGNVKQFWDGRADSLEAQIDGPLQHPNEMGSSWPDVIAKLRAEPAYVTAFAIYPEGIASYNAKDAIAAYERTLATTDSRFDAYLKGDATAISRDELEGYRLFKSYGCISCHQGRNVGGNVFEKLGVMGDYFAERGGEITKSDLGRFNVTGREEDRFRFRVPSLRLVTLTAPYFHDGHAATLEEAIVVMGKYQLGTNIPSESVALLAKFLGTLAGTYRPGEEHALR